MTHNLLSNNKLIFDRTLDTWKTELKNIKLQPDANMEHVKPFLVRRSHKSTFKKESERISQIGVLYKVNIPDWGSLTMIQPRRNEAVRLFLILEKQTR